MFTKQTEEKLLSWIKKSQLDEFGRYLVSSTVHGKPGVPVAELSRIEKLLKKHLTLDEQYALAKCLLSRSEYTARNIGTQLIASGWPKYKDVPHLARASANDEEWIVREYAPSALSALLEKDFAHFSKTYALWIQEDSVNLKRAIALAVKYHSKTADPKKWKVYFKLINPLMSEDHEYIRKNLGPFAIGDGLLSRYSEDVLTACQTWMKARNKNVRWNTAMIFTAAAARTYAKQGRPILKQLANDSEPFVARAAKKAFKNLEKR